MTRSEYAGGDMWRLGLLLVLAGGVALCQGLRPRAAATDYPASHTLADHAIAAEYMVHSIGNNGTLYVARDYLVVEAALFPAKRKVSWSTAQFFLRLNRKTILLPQSPQSVAAYLNHPSDEEHGHLEGSAGVGGVEVGAGRPVETSRFPGDPRVNTQRLPIPGRNPSAESGVPQAPAESIDDFVQRSALPEGEWGEPKAGFLFFYFRGKPKGIKSLELVYTSKGQEVVLPLL